MMELQAATGAAETSKSSAPVDERRSMRRGKCLPLPVVEAWMPPDARGVLEIPVPDVSLARKVRERACTHFARISGLFAIFFRVSIKRIIVLYSLFSVRNFEGQDVHAVYI